jgi:hypothetical protein
VRRSQDVLHLPSPLGLSRADTVVGTETHGGSLKVCLKDRNHDAMAAKMAASPGERLLDGRGRERASHHSLTYKERFESVDRYCYDLIIRCTGFDWDSSILGRVDRGREDGERMVASEGGRRSSKYPQISEEYESTLTPGIYAVGTIAHGRDKGRMSAGGFIHGFRYSARALSKWMEHKHHGVPWPREHLSVFPPVEEGPRCGRDTVKGGGLLCTLYLPPPPDCSAYNVMV